MYAPTTVAADATEPYPGTASQGFPGTGQLRARLNGAVMPPHRALPMDEETTIHHETVNLVAGGKFVTAGVFVWDEASEECRLTLRSQGQELTATESDYFAAMCTLRKRLKTESLLPHCYGASRCCYPSGMARDMGLGLQVYKLRLGQAAHNADLVSIFASGPDVEAVTVEEQQTFFDQWLKGPKQRTA